MKKLIILIAFLVSGILLNAQTYYIGRDLKFDNTSGFGGINYLTVHNNTGTWVMLFVEVEGTSNFNWFMISNFKGLFTIENCYQKRVHFIERRLLVLTNPPSWIKVAEGYFNVN